MLAIVKKVRLCLAIGRVRGGVLGRKGKGMRGSVAELKRELSGFLLCGQKVKIDRAPAHTRKSSPLLLVSLVFLKTSPCLSFPPRTVIAFFS